jgi:hypothetical protein
MSANFFSVSSVSLSSYCSRYWYTKYTESKAEMDRAMQQLRCSECCDELVSRAAYGQFTEIPSDLLLTPLGTRRLG